MSEEQQQAINNNRRDICYRLILDKKLLIVLNLVQEKGKCNEDFANSMSDLIKSIKLNNQEAKSNGQLEESDADVIPFTLFTNLCQCAIQTEQDTKPLSSFSSIYFQLYGCIIIATDK